ncbi:hypothetical protein [Mycobacterium uberis]|nr:hypothetical protein [Mycobacterium uberis]
MPNPKITSSGQALVRLLLVACCDLDVRLVCHGRLSLPQGMWWATKA